LKFRAELLVHQHDGPVEIHRLAVYKHPVTLRQFSGSPFFLGLSYARVSPKHSGLVSIDELVGLGNVVVNGVPHASSVSHVIPDEPGDQCVARDEKPHHKLLVVGTPLARPQAGTVHRQLGTQPPQCQ
jgi:hypothetical protein